MQYFYNQAKKKTVAHIWTGDDTACTMFSTGGLKGKSRNIYPDNGNKPVCVMCENNWLNLQLKDKLDRQD